MNNTKNLHLNHNLIVSSPNIDFYIYELDENIKVCYLSMPKCASIEIRHIFTSLSGHQQRLEIKNSEYSDSLFKDTFIFTFIRNPFERFHSAFNMMFEGTSLELPDKFLEFSQNPDVCTLNNPEHWKPQCNKLILNDGTIIPQYIGQINDLYENIEDIINHVVINEIRKKELIEKLNDLKKNTKQHVLNKNFDDNNYYRVYYNKETYNNVKKYLKFDIKLFKKLQYTPITFKQKKKNIKLSGVYIYFYNRAIQYINNYNKTTNKTSYLVDHKNEKSKKEVDLKNVKIIFSYITMRKHLKENYPEWMNDVTVQSHIADQAFKEASDNYGKCMDKYKKDNNPFKLKNKKKKSNKQ